MYSDEIEDMIADIIGENVQPSFFGYNEFDISGIREAATKVVEFLIEEGVIDE